MESPHDPALPVKVENGHTIELNGKGRVELDVTDRLIVDYAIDVAEAERTMQPDALEIVRMLVDIHVSQEEIIIITTAIAPTKAVEVIAQMSVVGMMMVL